MTNFGSHESPTCSELVVNRNRSTHEHNSRIMNERVQQFLITLQLLHEQHVMDLLNNVHPIRP